MENGLRILPVRIYLRIINRILGGCGVLTFTDKRDAGERRSSCALLLCFHWMKFPVNSTGQNVHVRLRPFRFEMPAPDEAAEPDRYCLPGVRSAPTPSARLPPRYTRPNPQTTPAIFLSHTLSNVQHSPAPPGSPPPKSHLYEIPRYK